MNTNLRELKNRLMEVNDLRSANALLNWDQSTYMPPGGVTGRARQMATLTRIAQEKFTDPAIGKLLDKLLPYQESLPYDSDDASLIRITRHDYERAVRVPPAFMGELESHTTESFQVWAESRPANDFKRIQPYLEKTLDFSRKLANFFPGYKHIADPLIDWADRGMTAASIKSLFSDLRKEQLPLVNMILSQPPTSDACLHQNYPEGKQLAFGVEVINRLGYDFQRGRQDKTYHPFMTKFSLGDVRITTRVDTHNLGECLFSLIHESGHAMYEQGINMVYDGTPLAGGTSSGMHESQSRLWENVVGRSRGFWSYYYPQLEKTFPKQLKNTSQDTFYGAINKVEQSLIRTDADEVTYNLHVMIRFDLELALLEGSLAVRDLPEAWCTRYQQDLGITPPDDRDGVLQDVHWYGGVVGGVFQGYTLGNILGALFYEAALKTHPEIPSQIEKGQFDTLRRWLTDNIYQHGRKFTAEEIVQRITGGPIRIEPYINYLRTKYTELYKL